MRPRFLAGAVLAAALAATAGGAQARPASPATAPAAPASDARPDALQSDAAVVLTLVRTTLVALHQANVTGNYGVLRDLATPGFREKNTDADLARIFAPVRNARIDLGAVVLLDPHLSRATLTQQKMLDVAGSLDTKPLPVTFELMFQVVGGAWKIDGIAVRPLGAPGPAGG